MKNIGAMLKQRAVVSPQLEAYVEPSANVRMDYTEMNALANQCASVLTSLGVGKGDRVALLMPNSVEFCCLVYGAAKIGAVAVPLNTRLTAPELEFILSDSGSKVLVHGEAFAAEPKPSPRAPTTPAPSPIGCRQPVEAVLLPNALTPQMPANRPANTVERTTCSSCPRRRPRTSKRRGAYSQLGAHRGEFMVTDPRRALPGPRTTTAADVPRGGADDGHRLRHGGVSLISVPQFDPVTVWSLIVEERVSIGGAVPAILNFMRQVPQFAELNAPDFRYFITGGASMPEALIKMYAAKNMQVVQGYALTESCGGGTLLLGEDALRKVGSAGRATMFADVRVRSDDGVISERGEGEVVIKSDFLLKEYWNRPDATRGAFDNGWFRTGDIGEIDDDGYLYIKDRMKDMIISGGENIYPAEIESVMIGIPGVTEVAVIGLSDEKWGEIACAIVVADQSEVSQQQIVEFCGARLARYKLPKKVIFADEIPRNPSGKILKRVLRDKYR